MDFKFIHAADIHLDSPLVGLERYAGAPVAQVRGATRRSLSQLVQLALDERVDFILIAGDLYDGTWRDYHTGLFFAAEMAKLKPAGIRVILVRGNHDAQSQITHRLHLPDNVRDLATDRPETYLLEDLGVAIHGQGFPVPAVREDLSRHYPPASSDHFNIGLLHTCASGRAGHDSYAPCDPNHLRHLGYHYWALGHVHRQEVLSREPWMVFPGNTQGRHIRETGPKGCMLVEVEAGAVAGVEHYPLDVLRWAQCTVDITGSISYSEVLDRVGRSMDEAWHQADLRLLALRVLLVGESPVHEALLRDASGLDSNVRALAMDRGQGNLWVEKVKLDTGTPPTTTALGPDHPIAALWRYWEEFETDQTVLEDLVRELERERLALPSQLFSRGDLDPGCPASLARLLPDVRALILARLGEKEGFGRAP